MRPVQALSDGEGHGGEGERFLLQRHRYRRGDGKHLGIARPCPTPGEPPRPLPDPHLTGGTATPPVNMCSLRNTHPQP